MRDRLFSLVEFCYFRVFDLEHVMSCSLFPKCIDKTLGACGVKSLLVYLRQILRKKKKLKTSQEILRSFRVWGDGVEGGGADEHGFYLRMSIIKQLLEVMCFLTQNAYNAVLQC